MKTDKTPKKTGAEASKSPGHHKTPKYEQSESNQPLSTSTYNAKKGGKK